MAEKPGVTRPSTYGGAHRASLINDALITGVREREAAALGGSTTNSLDLRPSRAPLGW